METRWKSDEYFHRKAALLWYGEIWNNLQWKWHCSMAIQKYDSCEHQKLLIVECIHVRFVWSYQKCTHWWLRAAAILTYSKMEMLFDMAGLWFYLPDTNTWFLISPYKYKVVLSCSYVLCYTHFVRVSIIFLVVVGIFEAEEFCFHSYMGKHNYRVLLFFLLLLSKTRSIFWDC